MQQPEHEYNKTISDIVRRTRTMMGLSQKDLATRIGVTFQQIQKYECGDNSISIYRLCQISDALEVSFEKILVGVLPNEYRAVTDENFIKSLSENEILKLIKQSTMELQSRKN